MPIGLEKVKMPAYLRALKQPLYDTEEIPADAAAVSLISFFQDPVGGTLAVSGTTKEEAETNLTQSGQLADPIHFDLFGFTTSFMWDMYYKDVNTANETIGNFLDDFTEVYEQGVYIFYLNQVKYYEIPLTKMPHGPFMLTGDVATASDNATNAGITFSPISNGYSNKREYIRFDVDGKLVHIFPLTNFKAEIKYPNAAVGLSAGGDESRFRTYLHGIMHTSL